MGQHLRLKFLTPNPPDRPEVTVDGRMAEIIYKLLLAAEDITEPTKVNISIQCWDENVILEVPKKY